MIDEATIVAIPEIEANDRIDLLGVADQFRQMFGRTPQVSGDRLSWLGPFTGQFMIGALQERSQATNSRSLESVTQQTWSNLPPLLKSLLWGLVAAAPVMVLMWGLRRAEPDLAQLPAFEPIARSPAIRHPTNSKRPAQTVVRCPRTPFFRNTTDRCHP